MSLSKDKIIADIVARANGFQGPELNQNERKLKDSIFNLINNIKEDM
jgi:hypothetical protein